MFLLMNKDLKMWTVLLCLKFFFELIIVLYAWMTDVDTAIMESVFHLTCVDVKLCFYKSFVSFFILTVMLFQSVIFQWNVWITNIGFQGKHLIVVSTLEMKTCSIQSFFV